MIYLNDEGILTVSIPDKAPKLEDESEIDHQRWVEAISETVEDSYIEEDIEGY